MFKEIMILLLVGMLLVRPVLRYLFPLDHKEIEIWAVNPDKHNGYAPDGTIVPQNKNWHLRSMMKRYDIQDTREVLLVDDLESNIDGAKLEEFKTILVHGKSGFNIKESIIN